MKARKPKLNPGKTKTLLSGTAHQRKLINEPFSSSEKVRNLGVVIYSNLTLENKITENKK